jgi:tetratricopeptide (TPR) repeat protein
MELQALKQQALAHFRADNMDQAISFLETICHQTYPAWIKEEQTALIPFHHLDNLLNEVVSGNASQIFWQQDIFFESALLLALCYQRMGDIEAAIYQLEQLDHLYPPCVPVTHLLGKYRCLAGDYEGAIAELTRTLQIDPSHAPVYADLAHIANLTQNYEIALNIIQQGLAIAPTKDLLEELIHACLHLDMSQMGSVLVPMCLHAIDEVTF